MAALPSYAGTDAHPHQAEAAARKGHLQARYVYVPAGADPDVEDRLRAQLNAAQMMGATCRSVHPMGGYRFGDIVPRHE